MYISYMCIFIIVKECIHIRIYTHCSDCCHSHPLFPTLIAFLVLFMNH